MTQIERSKFEAWIKTELPSATLDRAAKYLNVFVEIGWQSWQAALASHAPSEAAAQPLNNCPICGAAEPCRANHFVRAEIEHNDHLGREGGVMPRDWSIWHRAGNRMYRRNSDYFNAVIFGSPAMGLWAWAVWSKQGRVEGVEFGLSQARKKANEKIQEAELLRTLLSTNPCA